MKRLTEEELKEMDPQLLEVMEREIGSLPRTVPADKEIRAQHVAELRQLALHLRQVRDTEMLTLTSSIDVESAIELLADHVDALADRTESAITVIKGGKGSARTWPEWREGLPVKAAIEALSDACEPRLVSVKKSN
jgi:hypothetical protein